MLLFIIFTIASCYHDKQSNILLSHITEDTLRGKPLKYHINSRMACHAYQSKYGLVAIVANRKGVIQIRDYESGAILKSDINFGKGINELMHYIDGGFSEDTNELYFFSTYSKSYRKYLVTLQNIELIESVNFGKEFPTFSSAAVYNANYIVVSTIFDGNNLAIYDKEGNYIDHIPIHLFGEEVNYNVHYHPIRIVTNPNRETIVIGDHSFSYLSMFKFQNEKLTKEWGKFLIKPDYRIENNRFSIEDTHFDGISWLEITDDRIYIVHDLAFYHDRTKQFHSYLFIFDYDGNFLQKYYLDYNLHTFSISKDENTLYGITDYPDILFVKYHLP